MIYIIIFAVALNAAAYVFEYLSWKQNCKKYGKEHLAVSLKEGMTAVFMAVTLPTVIGLLWR